MRKQFKRLILLSSPVGTQGGGIHKVIRSKAVPAAMNSRLFHLHAALGRFSTRELWSKWQTTKLASRILFPGPMS
jgi:hypothetical protein